MRNPFDQAPAEGVASGMASSHECQSGRRPFPADGAQNGDSHWRPVTREGAPGVCLAAPTTAVPAPPSMRALVRRGFLRPPQLRCNALCSMTARRPDHGRSQRCEDGRYRSHWGCVSMSPSGMLLPGASSKMNAADRLEHCIPSRHPYHTSRLPIHHHADFPQDTPWTALQAKNDTPTPSQPLPPLIPRSAIGASSQPGVLVL